MNYEQQTGTMTPDGYYKETAGTMGTEARLAFLRRVYGWFFLGVIVSAIAAAASAALCAPYLREITSNWVWLGIIGAYFVLSMIFNQLILKRETAVLGLSLQSVAQGLLFGPLIAIALLVANGEPTLVFQALGITGLVFGGLTGYVFITKQDFSFLRGALVIGSLTFLGVIIISLVSGGTSSVLSLGICGFGIMLASGYVLYDTSQIVNKYGDGDEVIAAACLHADFALMLWYVLRILIYYAMSSEG
ncbi:MAG: Bax inhibitor-1 family protein [Planctomycetota bacterium]